MGSFAYSQETASVLKAGASDVVADVIVTDGKGRHVRGPTGDDFNVYEDGRSQREASFLGAPLTGRYTSPRQRHFFKSRDGRPRS
jgi:hypothetical protein